MRSFAFYSMTGIRTIAIIYILMVIGGIIGYVIFFVAIWRGMKAHESIAESIRRIADKHGALPAPEPENKPPEKAVPEKPIEPTQYHWNE